MSNYTLTDKRYVEGIIHGHIQDYEETEHDFEKRLCIIVHEFENRFDIEMSLPNGSDQFENVDGQPLHEFTYYIESFKIFKSQSIRKLKSYVMDALEVLTKIDREVEA